VVSPQGGLVSILTGMLEKAANASVAIDDLYRAYAARVKPEQKLAPGKFAEAVAKFCRKNGIRTPTIDIGLRNRLPWWLWL
jgi:hypothetical protein